MLGKLLNKRMAQRLVIAEKTVTEQTEALKRRDDYIAELEGALANRNTCVNIVRNGRANIFRFIANGQLVEIETMGVWGDDVTDWCAQLGITQ